MKQLLVSLRLMEHTMAIYLKQSFYLSLSPSLFPFCLSNFVYLSHSVSLYPSLSFCLSLSLSLFTLVYHIRVATPTLSRHRNYSCDSVDGDKIRSTMGSQSNTHVNRLARSGSAASLAVGKSLLLKHIIDSITISIIDSIIAELQSNKIW